jgi:hypothetical protein
MRKPFKKPMKTAVSFLVLFACTVSSVMAQGRGQAQTKPAAPAPPAPRLPNGHVGCLERWWRHRREKP